MLGPSFARFESQAGARDMPVEKIAADLAVHI